MTRGDIISIILASGFIFSFVFLISSLFILNSETSKFFSFCSTHPVVNNSDNTATITSFLFIKSPLILLKVQTVISLQIWLFLSPIYILNYFCKNFKKNKGFFGISVELYTRYVSTFIGGDFYEKCSQGFSYV